MEKLWVFIISFIFMYLLYLVTVVLRKAKMEKYKKSVQIQYFVRKYKLNLNNINMTRFSNLIALTNSFIIALTMVVTEYFENYFIKLIIGFFILIPLIIICYSIIGNYQRKKEK